MPQRVSDEKMTDMMQDQLIMVTALYNIAHESDDAEIVRTAAAALMNTEAGRAYTAINPINL
jgi:hypothetical protein